MIEQLYQKAILRHAAAARGHGALVNARWISTLHNPLCGDRITVYFDMKDGRITAFGHEAKACVLCQACASILGDCAVGETETSLEHIHDALARGLLQGDLADKAWPAEKWRALNIFQPVADHKNRHTCVTLPFQGLLQAFREGRD